MSTLLDEKIVEYRRMVSGRGGNILVDDEDEISIRGTLHGALDTDNRSAPTEAAKVGEKDEEHTRNFKLPLLSYGWSQAYDLLYLRFNRKAQQTQMEMATDQENVPLRQTRVEKKPHKPLH